MYSLIGAKLRMKGAGQGYVSVDVGSIKLFDLLAQYKDGYIELSEPSLKHNTFLTLDTLRTSKTLPITNITFNQWLNSLGRLAIPTSGNSATIVSKHIQSADVYQAGYSVNRIHPNDVDNVNVYPLRDKTDVFITKPLSDVTPLHKRTLTTVNGLLHINVPARRGLQIKDAGKSLDIENEALLGVISFENVADIEQVPIVDEMIGEYDPVYGLKSAAYLNLDRNLTNKTVLLSFCGRLLGADGLIEVINPQGGIRINLYQLDLLQIIQESKVKIDLSSLDLDERLYQANAIHLADVFDNNGVVRELLKLSQTFIIIVDTPILVKDCKLLSTTKLDGRIESENFIQLPYVTAEGLLIPYWLKTYQNGPDQHYIYHLPTTVHQWPVYQTGDLADSEWVNNVEEITNPDIQLATFLDIRTETLILEE